jgi:hypothetical protein
MFSLNVIACPKQIIVFNGLGKTYPLERWIFFKRGEKNIK